MPTRYLDPKVDLAFKRVFGEHEHLLRSFLNALLPLPDDGQIESLEYLTPEQVPELPGLFKNSIVDVKCKDARGRTFIVEMQMLWSTSFKQRILFSASQAYVKQLHEGQNYASLQPVYALALTNQVFDRATPEYYHHYQIVRQHEPRRVLEGLEFVFIELPKFAPQSRTDKRMQVKWLRFMSEVGEMPRKAETDPDTSWREDPDIAQALELVEAAAFTEQELEAYHIQIDKARIETTVLEDARAEAKAEGEAAAKVQMVRAMHASGLDLVQIAQITGLSRQQIDDLLVP
ncbi:MAG: hypothetical protein CFE38_07070 [Comamonadaceae bacterium PBBC1]|nr:MAG: hypothetical protein CFE38_07070 [Comamonadaceae bacterium PBBC1]